MSAVTNSTWTTLSFVNEAASSSSTTASFVTLKWKCFKMVCSHVEEESVLQEFTGVVIPTKPRMSDWMYTPASSGRGKHLHWGYCQICCIALRICRRRRNSGFFCSVNHLSKPLRKHTFICTSTKGQVLRFVIGGSRSVRFFLYFKVRCL